MIIFEKIAGILYFLSVIFKDFKSLLISKRTDRKLCHLDIEPTNICNANCVFCAYQYQNGPIYKEVETNSVKKALDAFCTSGGGDIGLTPIVGDPLVCKNIEDIIILCKSYKEIKNIGLTTNGILLTADKFIKLQDAGLTNLNISMTYPDENEYKTIYRSKKFSSLMENLNRLLLLDKKNVKISLCIRSPRFFLRNHSLFKEAKTMGWEITRNIYFDDWSGMVKEGLKENKLLRRPLRGKHLPCTMLQSGPHLLASGKLTACGCRDLEGKSELSDPKLFASFYESGDLEKVYYGSMDNLRNKFLNHDLPVICATCRHYNPEYRFASLKDKLIQMGSDFNAAMKFIFESGYE